MSAPRRISRRRALAEGAAGAGLVLLSGCGGAGGGRMAASSGSTLRSTWIDPVGDGKLRVGTGEPLRDRVELAGREAPTRVLGTLAHITDAHVLDASSPARVTFLDRLGPPFQSTFRPHEALTAQVLAGTVAAVRALRPQLVIQGGDLIDNDQENELSLTLAVLRGGPVRPGSGPEGYHGVQLASNPDPFYYRPDLDAPRHPGLLEAAVRPFVAAGLGAPWCPVLGDHDALVAGELVPTPLTASLALGDRALWDLPQGLTVPPRARLTQASGGSPDGPPAPVLVDRLLTEALRGPTVQVPADPGRRQLSLGEAVTRLRAAAPVTGDQAPPDAGARLDYALALGASLFVIVLDLVRRAGGSGGLVVPGQAAWLERALAAAGARRTIVLTHQPLVSSAGGEALLELLDHAPHVIATLAGHTHRNRILPRPTPSGGYWQIETASLVDFPQQARALRVVETAGGGIAIQTWMLDHVARGPLGLISRQLSYIDAQGGRPHGFAGDPLDRNVTLYLR